MVATPDGNVAATQAERKRRVLLLVALGAFGLAIMFLAGALATSAWWTWVLAVGWTVMGLAYLWLRQRLNEENP